MKNKKLTQKQKLAEVMKHILKKGYKRYKPTAEWIDRKVRARAYYGIVLRQDFLKAYFGQNNWRKHASRILTRSDDVLDYFLSHK